MGPPAHRYLQTQKPARVFVEFPYQTTTGASAAKAEYMDGEEIPRYVVISLPAEAWRTPQLCEERYCARDDMENRIQEQFTLFADHVSAEAMRANHLRIHSSAMAYVLVCALRCLRLKATEFATAHVFTIRTPLLKNGGIVKVRVQRIVLSPAAISRSSPCVCPDHQPRELRSASLQPQL
jgi:hypothetical protein